MGRGKGRGFEVTEVEEEKEPPGNGEMIPLTELILKELGCSSAPFCWLVWFGSMNIYYLLINIYYMLIDIYYMLINVY